MTLNTPWTRYLLLQTAIMLATGLALAFWDQGLLLLYAVSLIVGIVLIVKVVSRRLRTGTAKGQMVNTLVLTTIGLAIAWTLILAAFASALRLPPMGAGFLLLWAPPLGLFSSGSMAYLGLGPFRVRL